MKFRSDVSRQVREDDSKQNVHSEPPLTVIVWCLEDGREVLRAALREEAETGH